MMVRCSNCGAELPDDEPVCPQCGNPRPSREEEIRGKIEDCKEKRRRALATFILSMFGMYVLPFSNLVLVLAIISFGILLPMSVYYTWKKRQAEDKLEKEREEGLTD